MLGYMWLILLFLLAVVLLCKDQFEGFATYAGTQCMKADEYQKYLTGYPNQTFEYSLNKVAHPKHYFYDKHAPYTFGGYYQGQEYPIYW